MKKYLVTLFAILLGCVTVVAGDNPLRLKNGSLSLLKTPGGTISVSIDFSKTKGNRKPLERYVTEDFDSDMATFRRYEPEMLEWFCDRWDDDIEEGPRAVKPSEDAKYQLKIVVKTLQMGAKSGWGGASISGYAEFYRTGETEPFAIVEILKMNGTQMGGAMYGYVGLKQVFSDLGEHLCDLIYHN